MEDGYFFDEVPLSEKLEKINYNPISLMLLDTLAKEQDWKDWKSYSGQPCIRNGLLIQLANIAAKEIEKERMKGKYWRRLFRRERVTWEETIKRIDIFEMELNKCFGAKK